MTLSVSEREAEQIQWEEEKKRGRVVVKMETLKDESERERRVQRVEKGE